MPAVAKSKRLQQAVFALILEQVFNYSKKLYFFMKFPVIFEEIY